MTIRPGAAADLAVAREWLSGVGLPKADLTPEHMTDFLFAELDNGPAGMIGLEQFGVIGLLRSLVVGTAVRQGGVGRRLVAALEANAASKGIEDLWLLTIDADTYFLKLGYEVMERADAPDAIRNTAEFSKLCPGDAALMKKAL